MNLDNVAFNVTKMRRLVAVFDWENTTLGAIRTWPTEIRTQVQLCLDSDQPMMLALGDEHIQIYNDKYIPILGEKHPSALGQRVTETWAEIGDFLEPSIAQVLRGKTLSQVNFPLVIKQKRKLSERYFTFSYSPLRNSSGLSSGILSVASDTTSQVNAERRAATLAKIVRRVSPERKTAEVWQSIRDALVENRRDAFSAVLFSIEDDMPGSPIWSIGISANRELADLRSQIARATGQRRQIKIRRPAHISKKRRIGEIGIALPIRSRERRMAAYLVIFPHDLVSLTRGLLRFYNDISTATERALEIASVHREELSALRKELVKADVRYKFLFESLGEGVIYSGTTSEDAKYETILAVNSSGCRMLGFTSDELVGHTRQKFIFPNDQVLQRALKQRAKEGFFRGEIKFKRANGTPLWVDVTSNILFEETGEHQAITIFRDASRRREMEEKAKHAERLEALGQLTGGVAHDFNNLLTAILGGADELTREKSLGAYEKELASTIKSAAERGHLLTGQLLAYARRQNLRSRMININRIVANTAPLLQHFLTGSAELQLHLEEKLPRVRLDSQKLQAALLNLTGNARDAMPIGGEVKIITARLEIGKGDKGLYEGLQPGEYVRLSVQDNGTGIAADAIPKIFEPFFTTKPPGEGTGLGLSMVQGFIAQSGGEIRVETAWGKGTSIHLILPALH